MYTCSNSDFETETAIKEELGYLAVAGTASRTIITSQIDLKAFSEGWVHPLIEIGQGIWIFQV